MTASHWTTVESEVGKHTPTCECGWTGMPQGTKYAAIQVCQAHQGENGRKPRWTPPPNRPGGYRAAPPRPAPNAPPPSAAPTARCNHSMAEGHRCCRPPGHDGRHRRAVIDATSGDPRIREFEKEIKRLNAEVKRANLALYRAQMDALTAKATRTFGQPTVRPYYNDTVAKLLNVAIGGATEHERNLAFEKARAVHLKAGDR